MDKELEARRRSKRYYHNRRAAEAAVVETALDASPPPTLPLAPGAIVRWTWERLNHLSGRQEGTECSKAHKVGVIANDYGHPLTICGCALSPNTGAGVWMLAEGAAGALPCPICFPGTWPHLEAAKGFARKQTMALRNRESKLAKRHDEA